MRNNTFRTLCMILPVIFLAACGTTVPQIKEAYEPDNGTQKMEFEIRKRVFCDLAMGVQSANKRFSFTQVVNGRANKKSFIPLDWIAQVSLLLEADEFTTLSPGVSLNTPRANATSFFPGLAAVTTAQMSSVGLGGNFSSTSSNIHKFDPYYPVSYLMTPLSDRSVCFPQNDLFKGEPTSSSLLVINELGIKEWLADSMETANLLPSQKAETITLEIKFIVVTSGSVTPTWKLVRISANTTGTLFSDGRTRTHDLIITLGPKDANTTGTHLASQISSATGSANRNALSTN